MEREDATIGFIRFDGWCGGGCGDKGGRICGGVKKGTPRDFVRNEKGGVSLHLMPYLNIQFCYTQKGIANNLPRIVELVFWKPVYINPFFPHLRATRLR